MTIFYYAIKPNKKGLWALPLRVQREAIATLAAAGAAIASQDGSG
ncbi:MAG TPA: hypothetical protein V6C95_17365 [Coleofasciculaceae cyanobacterium]